MKRRRGYPSPRRRFTSLYDIWQGEEYEAFRRQLASDEPPEICRSCSVYRGVF